MANKAKIRDFGYELYESKNAPGALKNLIEYREIVLKMGHYDYFSMTYLGVKEQYNNLINQLPLEHASNFKLAFQDYLLDKIDLEAYDNSFLEINDSLDNQIIAISEPLYRIYGNSTFKGYLFGLFLFIGIIALLFTLIFGMISLLTVAFYKLQTIIWAWVISLCSTIVGYLFIKKNKNNLNN